MGSGLVAHFVDVRMSFGQNYWLGVGEGVGEGVDVFACAHVSHPCARTRDRIFFY